MAAKKDKEKKPDRKVVARNRRARFNYRLEATVEAGIVLVGTEVKSLRQGTASLGQAWCRADGAEIWLIDANIPAYKSGSWTNHDPIRKRKLLLHRRQIKKIQQELKLRGRTLVPLEIYFNESGRVKLEIAIALGKKQHDKRQALADRESQREMDRVRRKS